MLFVDNFINLFLLILRWHTLKRGLDKKKYLFILVEDVQYFPLINSKKLRPF